MAPDELERRDLYATRWSRCRARSAWQLSARVAAGRAFVVVEHARLQMVSSLPPGQRMEVLVPEMMNRFALVRLEDP